MYIHLLVKTKVKTWTKVVHKNVSQGFKMLKFFKSFIKIKEKFILNHKVNICDVQ